MHPVLLSSSSRCCGRGARVFADFYLASDATAFGEDDDAGDSDDAKHHPKAKGVGGSKGRGREDNCGSL